jgi:hypothetical protein
MKQIYEAPEVQVINIELEGMIAASVGAPSWTPADLSGGE